MRNNSFFRLALLCCIIFALQATVAYADNHTFCDGIDNEIEPPLIFNESYYQAQVASYNEAISENPEDVELLTLRGDGYYALRMYDESLADFSLASELDPESTYALARLGDSYQQIFAIEAAIDIYTQAIELDTDYTYAYIKRGTAYRKLADAMQSDSRSPIYALAMQDLDKAIELDANSPLAYSRRSEINLSLRRKWSALQDARLAVDVGQEFTFAYVVLANVYASRGNVLAAYDSLEDALGIATDRASDYAYAYSLHAELCRRAGAYERAITDANSAMEYDDTYALIYYTLARIALDLEDEDLAIEYLLEGIDHNPISPFAYEQLTLLEVDEAAYEDSFLIFETWLEFGEALELADSEEA